MSQAKCNKCGGSAIADTYEQARKLINHAVGLCRGIKCGDAYGAVHEVKDVSSPKNIPTPPVTKKDEPTVIETVFEQTIEPDIEPKTEKTKTSKKSKNKKY